MDATNVDGHDLGLSRVIFKSIHGRERVGMSPLCDISWLRDKRSNGSVRPANPLNIGQIVNNASDKDKFSANVTYHELDISLSEFEPRSRLFIPNIHYESVTLDGRSKDLRIVPLIATRDIEEGEELYSSYFSSVVK